MCGDPRAAEVQAARDRAIELRREIAGGVNPVERRRKDRAETPSRTFEALAARYMRNMRVGTNARRTPTKGTQSAYVAGLAKSAL
jgi:hypothetical protein